MGDGSPPPTYNPNGAKDSWETFLATIPGNLRLQFERSFNRIITDAVTSHGDPGLESLLPGLKHTSSQAILAKEFPPQTWIVPKYLPPGLTFISGKPKVGKSWLSLQLALAVRAGGKMFGEDTQAGPVLYLALEDNERRLQDRMRKQHWPNDCAVDIMLYEDFRDQIGTLESGGGKRLLAYIEKQNYRLVIVDTFSRAIQADQLDKQQMDQQMGPLQAYALRTNLSMVFIDHMPKNTSGNADPIAHLYGSVGKSGVADTFWALYKEQGKRGAKLAITGRDVDEYELKLDFDTTAFFWHSEGNAYQIELTENRQMIIDLLEESGSMQLDEIAKATGKNKGNLYKQLSDMVNAGMIKRTKRGLYEML